MISARIFRSIDLLNELGVEHCIISNTLLCLYRDKTPLRRGRAEVVFAVPIKERARLRKHPLCTYVNRGPGHRSSINFKGRINLNFYTEIDNYLIFNLTNNGYFVFEKDTILPFGKMEYRGKMLNVPNKIEKYLSEYYADWKTPDNISTWSKSPYVIWADSIEEALKIYKERSVK